MSQSAAMQMLSSLLDLFPRDGLHAAAMEIIDGASVPAPYHGLLVHRHHMTVTLEKHHGFKLDLVVESLKHLGADYARKILLTAGPDRKIVLAGIMRLQLQHCREEVRRQIVEQKIPLGRVLIEHKVLRWIEPCAYLKVRLDDGLREVFQAGPSAKVTFGRVARIVCPSSLSSPSLPSSLTAASSRDEEPAVQLLEIVAPEAP